MTLNDPTSYKDQTQNTSSFTGIWDKRQRPAQIAEEASKFSEVQPEIGVQNNSKMKGWGIGSVVTTFVLYLVAQIVLMVPALTGPPEKMTETLNSLATNAQFIFITAVTGYVVWVTGMWITSHRHGLKNFFKEYWVKIKWIDVPIGVGLAVALFGFAQGLSWLLGDVLGVDMSGAQNATFLDGQKGVWLGILSVGMVSLLGPVCEELFFRGYVLQGIARGREKALVKSEVTENAFYLKWVNFLYKYRYALAVIGSSVWFGLMHFQGTQNFGQWYVVILTGTLGLVFALTTVKLKRLGPSMIAHICYNGGTILTAFLLSGMS